jgi:serine-type D-Ala-D-Ala carboxypeptidase/endopeptidase
VEAPIQPLLDTGRPREGCRANWCRARTARNMQPTMRSKLSPLVALAGIVARLNDRQRPPDSAILAIIEQRVRSRRNASIVVGIIDRTGKRIISSGLADERHGIAANATTVFEIGSVTKVFTGALLAEMVGSGELRLCDPVRRFLPADVRVPSRDGVEITLLDLATHRSGLPRLPSNIRPADLANPYADYTVEHLYEFLSSYTLPYRPASRYEYSNVGAGLLGHVLALHAGTSFGQLLSERILHPLRMEDTGIDLSPALLTRMARGHSAGGESVKNWDLPTLAGAGGLRSTADDMMKFMEAQLAASGDGVLHSLRMSRAIQREGEWATPAMALGWHVRKRDGVEIAWHNGETGGYHSYAAIDAYSKAAVVVLTNTASDIDDIGMWVLESGGSPSMRLAAARAHASSAT